MAHMPIHRDPGFTRNMPGALERAFVNLRKRNPRQIDPGFFGGMPAPQHPSDMGMGPVHPSPMGPAGPFHMGGDIVPPSGFPQPPSFGNFEPAPPMASPPQHPFDFGQFAPPPFQAGALGGHEAPPGLADIGALRGGNRMGGIDPAILALLQQGRPKRWEGVMQPGGVGGIHPAIAKMVKALTSHPVMHKYS